VKWIQLEIYDGEVNNNFGIGLCINVLMEKLVLKV
jgi:hypothetical protein